MLESLNLSHNRLEITDSLIETITDIEDFSWPQLLELDISYNNLFKNNYDQNTREQLNRLVDKLTQRGAILYLHENDNSTSDSNNNNKKEEEDMFTVEYSKRCDIGYSEMIGRRPNM